MKNEANSPANEEENPAIKETSAITERRFKAYVRYLLIKEALHKVERYEKTEDTREILKKIKALLIIEATHCKRELNLYTETDLKKADLVAKLKTLESKHLFKRYPKYICDYLTLDETLRLIQRTNTTIFMKGASFKEAHARYLKNKDQLDEIDHGLLKYFDHLPKP